MDDLAVDQETMRQAVEACYRLFEAAGLTLTAKSEADIAVYLRAAAPILLTPEKARNAALTAQIVELQNAIIEDSQKWAMASQQMQDDWKRIDAMSEAKLAAESEVATLREKLAACERADLEAYGPQILQYIADIRALKEAHAKERKYFTDALEVVDITNEDNDPDDPDLWGIGGEGPYSLTEALWLLASGQSEDEMDAVCLCGHTKRHHNSDGTAHPLGSEEPCHFIPETKATRRLIGRVIDAEAREAALVAGIQNAADSLDTAAVEKVQLALRALLTKGAPHGD